ncbi:hypothetical protein [Tautonia plasticadhaerens]|uniref:hypothetical protein n=1 Tax=Tautonia plasticadhaerens TaxID=2527974 RepID=UPI0011AA8D81|nr:hypothetical protein [Tautonia plasticadhaerens]
MVNTDIGKLRRWFFFGDRQERLDAALRASYRASPFDRVPVPRAARPLLYEFIPPEQARDYYKSSEYGVVSRHRLESLDGPYGRWGRSDVRFDLVTAVDRAGGLRARRFGLVVGGLGFFAAGHGLLLGGAEPGEGGDADGPMPH